MPTMLKLLIITVILSVSSFVNAQVWPGNVGSNIALWLRADFGVLDVNWDQPTDGTTVAMWTDEVTAMDFTNVGTPTYQNDAASLFNYNPVIDFNGSTDYFSGASLFGTSTISEAAVYIVHKTRSSGSGGGLFCETTPAITGDAGRFMAHYSHAPGSGVHWCNSYEAGVDVWCHAPTAIFDLKQLSTFEVSFSADTRTISQNGTKISNSNENYQALTGDDNPFFVGVASQTLMTDSEFFADAQIAEIAVYNGGGNSGTDLQKIESYMAIKYGITLSNSGGGEAGDYLSTAADLLWDADITPSYHNHVIGIGRDDLENLDQRQSHTDDDVTRIYLGTLAPMTFLNNTGFTPNRSYLIVGDNNDLRCNTAASQIESPASIYSRLAREWKATNTRMDETFSMDITLESCAVLGSVDIADLRLLVDLDGDFTDADVHAAGAGGSLSFSYNNPVLTVSGISTALVPEDRIRYLTIGSVDVGTPLPVELVSLNAICNGSSTEVRWTTLTESNNDYYTIERSIDGAYFHEVGMVQGAGNSTELIDYVWVDNFSRNSKYFYRLKQTDFDGTVKTLLAAGVKCDVSEVSIYPNPFHNNLEIRFSEPTDSDFMVQVKNSLGQIVLIESISKETIEYHLSIDNDLNNGFYYIEIFNENEVKLSEKLIRL